jgi:hypothetical protein
MSLKTNNRDFNNENMEELCEKTENMSQEELDAILNRYPKSKAGFAALLLLVEEHKKDNMIDIDDWECDLDNIVWGEVFSE